MNRKQTRSGIHAARRFAVQSGCLALGWRVMAGGCRRAGFVGLGEWLCSNLSVRVWRISVLRAARPGTGACGIDAAGGVSSGPFASLNLSVSVADEPANVLANRARAYGVLGRTAAEVVGAHLVHGAEVVRVRVADHGTIPGRADGLITDEPGCGLTMNFADCAPILLYDPQQRAIGLGHAGWQGAVRDLPGALVRAMQAAFGSDPAGLWAGVGPCIGACCYEVGEPVVGAVREAFGVTRPGICSSPIMARAPILTCRRLTGAVCSGPACGTLSCLACALPAVPTFSSRTGRKRGAPAGLACC